MPLLFRQPTRRPVFDAVVLADGDGSDVWILGLTLQERARRVADRAGARRIMIATTAAERASIPDWVAQEPQAALVVIRARDQVVHVPLVEPLLDAGAARARSVTPDNAREDAGAAFADANAAAELATACVDDVELGAWLARPGVEAVPHGAIARHPVQSRADRPRAARYLCRMVHKPQDGPVTRYLYRPVSLWLTRLLLHTPITPNQVSYVVAVMGVVGIYFTAQYDYASVILGSAIILAAGYLDGCDGEIARLKLRSSKLGAWIDTLTDEATTVGYMGALGYHNYLRHPEPWVAGTIALGVGASLITIYAIYYYLIVVHGSANSQDYVDELEVVPGPEPGSLALRPVDKPPGLVDRLPGWAQAIAHFVPHIVRRDFINWGALAFAIAHLTEVSYTLMVAGAVVSMVVIFFKDHFRLRKQVRRVRCAPQSS